MVARVMPRDGRSRPSARLLGTAGLLVTTIILGGGTRSGFVSDVVLQLAAVPLLIASLSTFTSARQGGSAGVALAIVTGAVGLAVWQLVPLPAGWGWSSLAHLPRHGADDLLAAADELVPATVSPHATILAVLAGLPALAVFLSTCRLPLRHRRHLTLVVLAVGLICAFIGLLQVAQGPTSPLRFFAVTNASEAVGFFANRNHFSALLYVLLLFCAAWSAHAAQRFAGAGPGRHYDAEFLLPLLLSLTVVAILVAMQVFAKSRAGLGLTIAALLGCGLLSLMLRRTEGAVSSRLVFGAGVVGVLLACQFALYGVLERFESDPLADARIVFARNTIEAARANLPLGSGLGSFVDVYGVFERPRDALLDTYANRAHNDFLEVWLEAGLPGVVLFLVFAIWFLFASIAAWRRPRQGRLPIDVTLPRAASLVVLLLLLHSLVDYPLRTAALLAMFALACALLVPPAEVEGGAPGQHGEASQSQSASAEPRVAARATRRELPEPVFPRTGQVPNAAPRGGAWGDGIEWPAEWRRPEEVKRNRPNDDE